MAAIHLRQGLSREDFPTLLKWANSGGETFLRQFAGPKWRYPLTEDQVSAEIDEIYSIYVAGAFSGIVQRFPRRERSVHIGRFLIDPDKRGAGIGEMALRRFCEVLFEGGDVDTVSLNVYLFNTPARRCYEKCGFRVVGVRDEGQPWACCRMELKNGDNREALYV